MVDVHLGGHLNFYTPNHITRLSVDLEREIALVDLLQRLGIPSAEVAVAAINGEIADLESAIVAPQDQLDLYPPMGGGQIFDRLGDRNEPRKDDSGSFAGSQFPQRGC